MMMWYNETTRTSGCTLAGSNHNNPLLGSGHVMAAPQSTTVSPSVENLFSPEDSDLAALKWGISSKGYLVRSSYPRINGVRKRKNLYAHRIVASRLAGRELTPLDATDHINFNRLDNRRENLRVGTHKQNWQNCPARNATGIRGVTFIRKSGKWQAGVKTAGKSYHCGMFATPEEAGEAAKKKRQELGFPPEAA